MEVEHTDELLLIVVGAHLRAEITDRPIAYRLREQMLAWLDDTFGPRDDNAHPCQVVVCSDLWYLNNDNLRHLPTISIGPPQQNALTAYLADKIPSAFVIDDVFTVQLDVEFSDMSCCCWGVDESTTIAAVDAFVERYLNVYMNAATNQWQL